MYIPEDMIDMGLKDGQKWPSKAHRTVAANLALCNPMITTRDALTDIVQKVCKIPKDKIKTVQIADLDEFAILRHGEQDRGADK